MLHVNCEKLLFISVFIKIETHLKRHATKKLGQEQQDTGLCNDIGTQDDVVKTNSLSIVNSLV